jgi:hypothetical protein
MSALDCSAIEEEEEEEEEEENISTPGGHLGRAEV